MPVWVLVIWKLEDNDCLISLLLSAHDAIEKLHQFVCENWDTSMIGERLDTDTVHQEIDRFFDFYVDDYWYSLSVKDVPGIKASEEEEEETLDEIFVSDEELLVTALALQHVNFEDLAKEIGASPEVVEDAVIEIAKKLG